MGFSPFQLKKSFIKRRIQSISQDKKIVTWLWTGENKQTGRNRAVLHTIFYFLDNYIKLTFSLTAFTRFSNGSNSPFTSPQTRILSDGSGIFQILNNEDLGNLLPKEVIVLFLFSRRYHNMLSHHFQLFTTK